jgi:hypothetical protein
LIKKEKDNMYLPKYKKGKEIVKERKKRKDKESKKKDRKNKRE